MNDDVRRHHESNREAWNQGAAAYEKEVQSDIEFLRNGGINICPPERKFLHDLDRWCGRAIHLQCAGGRDTLSLWNLGAREVIGIDISERMIACAQAKATALGAPATFVRSDILDSPESLNGTADLVYTGRGALCWIMDLEAWAKTIYRLLKPGGRLYVFEGHPFSELWDMSASDFRLDKEYGDYFQPGLLVSSDWPSTYIGDEADGNATKYERQWQLGQVINAVIDSGLQLKRIEEHPDPFWERFPNLDPDMERRIPQTFSLLAERSEK